MRWAESSGGAASKFLIGPAVLAVHPLSKRLNIGLLNQNLFASEAAVTQLQPIVAYQVGGGWALSARDSQFTDHWKSGEWTSLPLGFQIWCRAASRRPAVPLLYQPAMEPGSHRGRG